MDPSSNSFQDEVDIASIMHILWDNPGWTDDDSRNNLCLNGPRDLILALAWDVIRETPLALLSPMHLITNTLNSIRNISNYLDCEENPIRFWYPEVPFDRSFSLLPRYFCRGHRTAAMMTDGVWCSIPSDHLMRLILYWPKSAKALRQLNHSSSNNILSASRSLLRRMKRLSVSSPQSGCSILMGHLHTRFLRLTDFRNRVLNTCTPSPCISVVNIRVMPPAPVMVFRDHRIPGKTVIKHDRSNDMSAIAEIHSNVSEACSIPRRSQTRKALPVFFKNAGNTRTVMTGYDTGTEANHISLDLAVELGYSILTDKDNCASFQLVNGKVIDSIGQISAEIEFAQEKDGPGGAISCYFNVFRTLAVPALMGMAFLNATETLTRYTCRLVEVPRSWKRSLRICSIGSTSNRVSCLVDGKPVIAHADTGSEIALVNFDYMMGEENFLSMADNFQLGTEKIMLADGSIEFTTGHVDVDFSLRNALRPWEIPRPRRIRFHVMLDLQFDFLLDEDLVEDFDVFQEGAHALLSGVEAFDSSLNTIIRLSQAEKALSGAGEKIGQWAASLFSKPRHAKATKSTNPVNSSDGNKEQFEGILQKIDEMDQNENRQREWFEKQNFAPNSTEARREAARRNEYAQARDKLVQSYYQASEQHG